MRLAGRQSADRFCFMTHPRLRTEDGSRLGICTSCVRNGCTARLWASHQLQLAAHVLKGSL